MAANGISTLQFKADRQTAKLNLASTNRANTGRPSTYDLGRLPTVYAPGDNTLILNNPNAGGLLDGRPWA